MPKTRVSLMDIARATGYSVMTVSYALRNHPKIKESTRALIRAKAEAMGYSPDPNMVKLMSRIRMNQKVEARSFVAVLDLFDERKDFCVDPYTRMLVESAEARLETLGYKMTRFRLREPGIQMRRVGTILASRGIEGMLIPPFPKDVTKLAVDWEKITTICTEDRFNDPALNKVIPHHYSNMLLLLEQLWARGYRRPALASCLNSLGRDNYSWFGAYYSFLMDRVGGEVIPPLPVANNPADVLQWYRRYEPDVIIVTEAWIADNFLQASGLQPGADVGVASVSAELGDYSGVHQSPAQIGSAAADILTAHIIRNDRGIPKHPKTMMIKGMWVDRGTVREEAAAISAGAKKASPRKRQRLAG